MSRVSVQTVDTDSDIVEREGKLRSQKPVAFYELAARTVHKRQSGKNFNPSWCNSQMAESAKAPPVFAGRSNEDADAFVKSFDRYVKFREITDDSKKLNLFAVLLKAAAADWLDALPDVSKDTFTKLSQAFADRYRATDSLKYKSASELFNGRQQENESVDEFITRQRKLARLVNVDENVLQFVIVNGLKPYIAAQVTQGKPESIEKILEVARLAEFAMAKIATASSDSAVCQQLADIQAEMRRLSVKVDKAMTAPIESRSPTPERRVRFTRSGSPGPRDSEASGVPRGGYTMRRPDEQRGVYNNQQRPRVQYSPRQQQPTTVCTRCARNHGKNSFCAARDPTKVCNFCGKHGHFQAACFSALGQY